MGKFDQGQGHAEQSVAHQLEQLPFIEIGDLITYATINAQIPTVAVVDVNSIVSGVNVDNWALGDPNRVVELSKNISSGEVVLEKKELPELFELNGLYGVLHDGLHRVAAMKLINLDHPPQTIRAEVSTIKPFTEVYSLTEDGYLELLKRRELGLWQGSIEGGPSSSSFSGFYASGKVDSYVGPWVFSRDMEKAKALFEACQKR